MYQNLTDAMKMFLSRGRPFLRKMVLGKGNPSERSEALAGNSILLAQPTPGEIAAVLPPPEEQMSDNLCVIFTTERSDVKRATPLQVSREQYLACAKLRKEQCYAFADVELGDASVLPRDGVPESLVRDAVSMPEAQYFEPSFDSVAKPQDASAKVGEDIVEAEDETPLAEATAAADDIPELQSRSETQALDGQTLLGLDEAHADDPLSQMLLLQKSLQVLTEDCRRTLSRQTAYHAAAEKDDKDVAAIAGGTQQCKERFVAVQELARRMKEQTHFEVVRQQDPEEQGENQAARPNEQRRGRSIQAAMDCWRQQAAGSGAPASSRTGASASVAAAAAPSFAIERTAAEPSGVLSAAAVPAERTSTPIGLNVQAGAPLSMFDPIS